MSNHFIEVRWARNAAVFTDNRYSRRHSWHFDGGTTIEASASPRVVPPPLSAPETVDPEEAFVAALSSCHMLWFLSIAAKAGFVVESYRDRASGELAPDAAGRLTMAEIRLRPEVRFAPGARPPRHQHEAMHEEAHERCFLANSVRSRVNCSPLDVTSTATGGTERQPDPSPPAAAGR